MPCSRAFSWKRRKSSSVPSSGWMALCPPSLPPIAQGLPTPPGPASGAVHVLAGLFRDAAEGVERAQLGVDGLVPSLLAADRPGAADVAGLGLEGVVVALAEGLSDRMDGGQIEHVEAHLGDVREARLGVAEGAVAAPPPGAAAGPRAPGG